MRALVLIACVYLAGCTVTLSATEHGAQIGLTLDPVSTVQAILNDKEKRP